MAPDTTFRLIGRGVYSLAEAARLTRIPPKRIRRWMEGYSFRSSGKWRKSPPIVASTLGRNAGPLALTFSDLIEVRFLEAFLQHGVSWSSVRVAAKRAEEILKTSHPFSTKTFRTDGRYILAEIAGVDGVTELLNLVKNQYEFAKVMPVLFAGLDFDDSESPERWWPMTRKKLVVIDPARAFGAPIVNIGGVPTAVLAQSVVANGTERMTAQIFDVPPRAVRHAVEYERSLAA
jgi:uncharacterized protein (DUF433 family)